MYIYIYIYTTPPPVAVPLKWRHVALAGWAPAPGARQSHRGRGIGDALGAPLQGSLAET